MGLSKNGTSETDSSFWHMWLHDLPCSFPKTEMIEELGMRWKLSRCNTYGRLRNEKFPNLKSDLAFLYNQFGIAFDCIDKGFFLDYRQYELARQNKELEAAKLFGLSK